MASGNGASGGARILLVTIGSWGDLFPFVGLAVELTARGHDVRVAASPAWEQLVTEAGVGFVPIGRPIGFDDFAAHPEIFRPVPFGLRAGLGRFLFDQTDELTRDLTAALEGTDLLITHPAHLVAQNVAEARGQGHVVATVFPSAIRSAHTVPGGSPFGPWSGRAGRVANRAAWLSAAAVTAALFDGANNRHRRQLGLRRRRGGLFGATEHALGTIVMAPPEVVGHPPDWPDDVVVTSFVDWDRATTQPLSEGTEAFLAAGEPPVLVTLGASSGVDPQGFFEQAARELTARQARVLAITGPAGTPTMADPASLHASDYEPFTAVAPRCRAVVHHGGIGTAMAVLEAGIPHLTVPRGFDQPVTAQVLERLGVGVTVPWSRRHRRLGAAIERILTDESLGAAASQLAARLEPNGTARSADAIEALLAPRAG